MGKVLMSGIVPKLTAPVGGTPLSSLAEGSIIQLNESGSPVDFYVAKHDYESGLNGAGRTLLVRKDCCAEMLWATNNVNAYASSTVNTWLNGTYKSLLDTVIQTAMGTTKFYFTYGNGNWTKSTMSASAFLLSLTEYGLSSTYSNVEGSALPIASVLRIGYLNGSAVRQWTRSPDKSSGKVGLDTTSCACVIRDTGVHDTYSVSSNGQKPRPAFTLPGSLLFLPDGTIKV